MKRKRLLLVGGKLLISGALIAVLYRKTPLGAIGGVLAGIDLRFMPIIAGLLFVNTLLSALKWRLLLLGDAVDIPLRTLTVTYLIGSFYNLFLPSNIGGDSYRIYDVARKSKEAVRSAASVFADRFSGFLALVILSLLSSLVVARRMHEPLFFLGPLLILIILVVFLAAMYKQTPVRKILALTRLNRFEIITRLMEKFFLSLDRYGKNRRLLVRVMVISFTFQLSVICIVYCLALSLHASASFFYFSAFVPLITLMEALPLSIYGIGIRDMGYVFFFGWAGLSDVQTRSLALSFLAVTVSYSLLGGLAYLWRLFLPSPGGKESS